jgi:hypothetical protein
MRKDDWSLYVVPRGCHLSPAVLAKQRKERAQGLLTCAIFLLVLFLGTWWAIWGP